MSTASAIVSAAVHRKTQRLRRLPVGPMTFLANLVLLPSPVRRRATAALDSAAVHNPCGQHLELRRRPRTTRVRKAGGRLCFAASLRGPIQCAALSDWQIAHPFGGWGLSVAAVDLFPDRSAARPVRPRKGDAA